MKTTCQETLSPFLDGGKYTKLVSQLNRKSMPWHLLLLFPRQLIKPQFGFLRDLRRIVRASRIQTNLISETERLPEIEVFTACVAKDMQLLPTILLNAVLKSANPVSGITVVTTPDLIETRIEINGILVNFVDENTLIAEEMRSALRARFGNRYGWVLQQLLTLKHVLNSSSRGVLVVNADTFITRKQIWLNDLDEQPLMCSYEYNTFYYEFLAHYNFPVNQHKCSHITHHMLMQPDKMRIIYDNFIKKNFPSFVEDIVELSENHISPICVEFELYAYGMLGLFPKLVKKRKFANIGVSRNDLMLSSKGEIENAPYFNSISMHDYLI